MDYISRLVLLAGVAMLLGLVALLALRLRRRSRLEELIRAISVDALHDILLPDATGGQIHLQHVLLTAKGLVVLDVKNVAGSVFAGDRLDEWTVIGQARRIKLANPLPALYDRVAALKALARAIPVTGHILFFEEADFSKGRPEDVIFPDELLDRYAKPEAAELERLTEAFHAHWERVSEASEPAPAAATPV